MFDKFNALLNGKFCLHLIMLSLVTPKVILLLQTDQIPTLSNQAYVPYAFSQTDPCSSTAGFRYSLLAPRALQGPTEDTLVTMA